MTKTGAERYLEGRKADPEYRSALDKAKARTGLTCAYCGGTFDAPADKGMVPRYCRDSHRQLAYQERRAAKVLSERGWTPPE